MEGVQKPLHGRDFKKWAALAMSKVPDILITTTHNYRITYKYFWGCTTKGYSVIIKRHSRSVDIEKYYCAKCN